MAIVDQYSEIQVKLKRIGPPDLYPSKDFQSRLGFYTSDSGVLSIRVEGETIASYGRDAWESAKVVNVNVLGTSEESS